MSDGGYVNAGMLLVVSSSLPASMREDILSSLLYAQLSSTKKYPELKDFKEWNTRQFKALQFLLYHSSGPVKDSYFSTSKEKSVSIGQVARKKLAPLISAAEMQSLEHLLSRLSSVDVPRPALELLTRHSIELGTMSASNELAINRIKLQIGIVDKTATLKLVTINLATRTLIKPNFIHQDFSVSDVVGDLELECFIAALDEDYAESKRDFVNTALDGRAEEDIEKLY